MRRGSSRRRSGPDPVMIFEPKLIYRTRRGEVPEGEHVVPLGGVVGVAREVARGRWSRTGRWSPVCERAADAAATASVEVLDLRTLKPLDEEALLASVAQDGPRRARPGGAADVRLRRRAGGRARREGDARPARARSARDRLRRAVPVLVRSRTPTCRPSRGWSTPARTLLASASAARAGARGGKPARVLLARPRACR